MWLVTFPVSPYNLRGHAVETGVIGFVHHSTAALISLLIWIGIDPVLGLGSVWVSGCVSEWRGEPG